MINYKAIAVYLLLYTILFICIAVITIIVIDTLGTDNEDYDAYIWKCSKYNAVADCNKLWLKKNG